ncbi:Mth938-like domain-containing protein [Nitrosomonas sp. Is37]|uniref:Mth938-like domain-containing protein n=1 Tax=Nitrosomonas sp. Is37 TaxID=3080535 RepID=UPI00294B3B04|nr:Mth938-like domain-containing protein [Nitrosomonas sp. Is37]MDV6344556.1 Mth938-like domain-containing protein [Nitrosomonas sp. Is37]
MKLHLSEHEGFNIFSGYGEGYIAINQVRYEHNLIVLPDHIIENWQIESIEQLKAAHFDCLRPFQPEIILLGTGTTLRFPNPQLMKAMISSGVGLEVMDTHATCRTYNVLAAEGRRVAAALII